MKVRLGFVAMTLRLENCSPSKTITLKNLEKISGYEHRIGRLTAIAKENLENTLRILRANQYDRIQVYRFTSKLIPLCTHPQFRTWNYCEVLSRELKAVGDFVKEHKMRVSMHPDHFTLLNSPNPDVLQALILDLEYHTNVLEAMGLDSDTKIVLHVGGKYNQRVEALERFKSQFLHLPERIKSRITVENDDRSFTAAEVLKFCKDIKAPMVFDLHHHQVLHQGEDVSDLWPEICATWENTGLPPKVHLSSPRDDQNPRYHADFIDADAAVDFLNIIRPFDKDIDFMIEAKQKDMALIRLSQDLKARGFTMNGLAEFIL